MNLAVHGFVACARLALAEGLRSRLGWVAAAYVAALGAAVLATRGLDTPARAAVLPPVLHTLTLAFGTFLTLAVAARGVPTDQRLRLLAVVFTKPSPRSAYLAGRLAGAWTIATLFALLAGVAGWGFLTAADLRIATREPVADADLRLAPDAAIFRWDAPGTEAVTAEIPLANNPYWEPTVRVTCRRLPDGPVETRTVVLTAGRRTFSWPVPADPSGRGGPVELSISEASEETVRMLLPADARGRLWRTGADRGRLWLTDVGLLWAEWLFAAAAALAASICCAWPLAFAAGAIAYLAANSLEMLRLLPQTLEPDTLREIFTPTIYHVHREHPHGAAGAHAAAEILRRVAEAAVAVFECLLPDFQALDPVGRLETGTLTSWHEAAAHGAGALWRAAAVAAAGAWRLSRIDPA